MCNTSCVQKQRRTSNNRYSAVLNEKGAQTRVLTSQNKASSKQWKFCYDEEKITFALGDKEHGHENKHVINMSKKSTKINFWIEEYWSDEQNSKAFSFSYWLH